MRRCNAVSGQSKLASAMQNRHAMPYHVERVIAFAEHYPALEYMYS